MTRSTGLVVLVVGIVLLGFGFNASDSLTSAFSRLFSGAPTTKTVWLLIGGMFCTGVGLFSVARHG